MTIYAHVSLEEKRKALGVFTRFERCQLGGRGVSVGLVVDALAAP